MRILWINTLFILFTGCHWQDPRYTGDVAYSPAVPWETVVETPYSVGESIDWPTVYPDNSRHDLGMLSVSELIAIALENNPQTQQAWENARAAAFLWRASQSALYPTIFWTGTFSLQDRTGATGSSASGGGGGLGGISTPNGTVTDPLTYFQQFSSDFTFSYLLLDFGGRAATIDAALQTLYNANWVQNRIIQSVIFNVLQAYYNLLNTKALLEARKKDLKDAETNYASANAQFQSGIKTKIDMLQTKAALVNFQLLVEQLINQVQTGYGQLYFALGVPMNTLMDVEDLPAKLPIQEITTGVETLMEIAKMNRPDLEAAYANYVLAEDNIIIAKSAGLPTLTTLSDLIENRFPNTPLLNGHNNSLAIALNVPIFSGWLYENQERAAKAQMEASLAVLKNTQQQVLLDVVNAYYAYLTAVETIKYSEEYLAYSQESYDATYAGYQQGTVNIVDLLVTQATLANARAQFVQARTGWVTALANISYATGVLNAKFSY